MDAVKRKVLIVVDAQNGFCEGGELASTGAADTCRKIAEYLSEHSREYISVILSKDWHIAPGEHFTTWPVHCVAGTRSADFFWPIQDWADVALASDSNQTVHEVRKGQFSDGYSVWEGFDANEHGLSAADLIRSDTVVRSTSRLSQGVDLTIDVCGLVTEHCVKATALDALKMKWTGLDSKLTVRLLEDLCTATSARGSVEALAEMDEAGVQIASSR